MSFCQNLLSTFIGALLGFIFSICLFYFTNKWAKKAIEKITVNDKDVFYYFNYIGYQRLFIQTYFQQGFLYEKLNPEDINLLDTILNHMGQGIEFYINNSMQRWKEGAMDQKDVLRIMTFERDNIEKYIKEIHRMKQKIIS